MTTVKPKIASNRSDSSMKNESRGKLIIVEGIDGSGKSTQIHLLEKWLAYKGISVFKSEWNSSEMVKEITSRGKKKGLLTPTTFSLLHATDFADRYERNILPLLRAGYFVLADRYVYTAFVRDIVRGCNPDWVRKVYDFAIYCKIVNLSDPVWIATSYDIPYKSSVNISICQHKIASSKKR